MFAQAVLVWLSLQRLGRYSILVFYPRCRYPKALPSTFCFRIEYAFGLSTTSGQLRWKLTCHSRLVAVSFLRATLPVLTTMSMEVLTAHICRYNARLLPLLHNHTSALELSHITQRLRLVRQLLGRESRHECVLALLARRTSSGHKVVDVADSMCRIEA